MNTQILQAAHNAWSLQGGVRANRLRNKRYAYGDQWGDPVRDAHGNWVREDDLVMRTGRKPLANNLIRRLIKTIVGRYRDSCTQTRRYSTDPASVDARNQLAELDSRLLEEFLISGCAVQRIVDECRMQGPGVWVDNVNPARFFTNPTTDPRGSDIEMCGMLHDMSLAEVLARFGGRDAATHERLRGIFGAAAALGPGIVNPADSDFFTAESGRCRVIEVWTLEADCRPDAELTFAWRCRWLAPTGELLSTYLSPYAHGSHPFVTKFYPLTDGEVHPFVEDLIDQQRFINRLIVLIDKMMGASAKGVLLFPVDQKVNNVSWEEIANRWSTCDGVIPINGRSTVMPQQISGNGADAGAHRLLDLELRLFNEVSGVSDALLGKVSTGTTGSDLFEAQLRSASVALSDLLETFAALTAARDAKCAMTHF